MTDTNIKKIMVVDDNEIFAHSIERHLRRQGFDAVIANNGQMAKELALTAEHSGAPFHLAITDILMPRMDGFAFVSWLNQQLPQVAVLIVTGFGNMDLINKVLRPHLDFLHRKPVLPQEIMRSIAKINLYRQGAGDLTASA